MTPQEFKAARSRLCLSQLELAILLNVGGDRAIRRWERGECLVPGPVEVLMREMAYLETPRQQIRDRGQWDVFSGSAKLRHRAQWRG